MPKFFVKDQQINDDNITVVGEDVNHIINVLRMKRGDILQICNSDNGINYIAEIVDYNRDNVKCEIKEKIDSKNESNVEITLFQGLPKFDKMEFIIQKATEIGVKEIVPVMMKRSIVKFNEKDEKKKLDRWQKIAEMAAKQSMRDIIPKIEPISTINELLYKINEFDVVLIAYENENKTTLKEELKKISTEKIKIAIIIGPEGGIDETEIDKLSIENVKTVTLGRRILRTETAGLVMASNIFYELEKY